MFKDELHYISLRKVPAFLPAFIIDMNLYHEFLDIYQLGYAIKLKVNK